MITEPSSVLVQRVSRVTRNVLREKAQINCQGFEKIQHEATRSQNLPVVSFSRRACRRTRGSVLRDMEVRKATPPLKRLDGSRKHLRTDFPRFGPGSAEGTELHSESDTSKVEVCWPAVIWLCINKAHNNNETSQISSLADRSSENHLLCYVCMFFILLNVLNKLKTCFQEGGSINSTNNLRVDRLFPVAEQLIALTCSPCCSFCLHEAAA